MASPAHASLDDLLNGTAGDSPLRRTILLDAAPLSGVTRSMYEAAVQHLPDYRLWNAPPAEIINTLRVEGFPDPDNTEPYLVWFDNIGPGDLLLLTSDILDTIAERGVLLANINTYWFQRILNDDSPLTEEFGSLLATRIGHVHVPFALTPSEREQVQATHPTVAFGASIAETFVGGDVILGHYDNAAHADPDGYTLVAAAIDARRAGVNRGLSDTELRRLFHTAGFSGRRSRRAFNAALAWAQTVPNGASYPPLMSYPGGGHRAFHYLAGADDGDHGHAVRRLLPATWNRLLTVLTRTDAFHIGVAAHLRGMPDIARAAFTRATQSHNGTVAERAAHALTQLS